MKKDLKFMYITNNVEEVKFLDEIGIDRIWIDLEKNGKEERQKNMNSVKSNHILEDIRRIRPFVKKSELLVRVNPIFEGSKKEIEKAIEYGADRLMLPMFKTKKDVLTFFNIVKGRCKTILLLETKEAVDNLEDILSIEEITNIHIGLNDLHLSYNNKFMFEPLANGLVESLCEKFKRKKIKYGFGGIAQIGEGKLPAELILSEHVRLGSSCVILSRSFSKIKFEEQGFEDNFINGKNRIIEEFNLLNNSHHEKIYKNHKKLEKIVKEIVGELCI